MLPNPTTRSETLITIPELRPGIHMERKLHNLAAFLAHAGSHSVECGVGLRLSRRSLRLLRSKSSQMSAALLSSSQLRRALCVRGPGLAPRAAAPSALAPEPRSPEPVHTGPAHSAPCPLTLRWPQVGMSSPPTPGAARSRGRKGPRRRESRNPITGPSLHSIHPRTRSCHRMKTDLRPPVPPLVQSALVLLIRDKSVLCVRTLGCLRCPESMINNTVLDIPGQDGFRTTQDEALQRFPSAWRAPGGRACDKPSTRGTWPSRCWPLTARCPAH